MAADPPNTDPIDQDPRERGLRRRSAMPAVGPWVVIILIALAALAVYAASALF